MRVFSRLWFVIIVLIVASSAFAQTVADLRREFALPPDDARIMMRWWWFGPSVTKAEIERELRVMRDGGIGGVEVQPVYPLLPDDPKTGHRNIPYLSDEFLDLLKFTSQKAKELGMRFDLTLGSGWSFGGAHTPITEAAGQLRIDRVKLEAGTRRVGVPSMIAAENFLAAYLVKGGAPVGTASAQRLTDFRDDNVFLPAPAEAGSEVIFFISGKSGMQVKRPSVGSEGYVLNHLDKPSVENYLKMTGDRLFEKLSPGEIPYSVFCDSLEVYHQDWTDDFDVEFQRRRGYDIKDHLPKLVGDPTPATADVRYDWGLTIRELFDERFMIPMQSWSKARGTKFRIQGYGIPASGISSNKWADISDGEGAQWKVVRAARWAASASHIFGRNITSSETWTWLNSPSFRATPLDMKAEADVHFLQGINQLIGHGWGYTPPGVEYPGWRFYAAGAYSEQNPWWIVMPDVAKYFQRASHMMRQGKPNNDVALYLPTADAFAHFRPGRVHLIEGDRELVGEKVMPALFEAGYNLDFFDDEVLRTIGSSSNGVLTLGASQHRAVVLPGVELMPLETLKRLEAFVRSGGKLVVTRRIPARIPGLRVSEGDKAEFDSISNRLFKSGNASVRFVENDEDAGTALRALVTPDLAITPSAKGFGFVHRSSPSGEIYFVANTSNARRPVELSFRAKGRPELWDPMSGRTYSLGNARTSGDLTTISHVFEPYGSAIIVFPNGAAATEAYVDRTPSTTVDISTNWNVALGEPTSRQLSTLRSWAEDDAGRFFSGTATYTKDVQIAADLLAHPTVELDFGEGTALPEQELRNGMRAWYEPSIREAAVVFVNGQRAGSLWTPPFRLDIKPFLRAGANSIRVLVGNTAMNHMAGRRLPDYRLLNLRYGERFQPQEMEKVQPLPSGILGPIRLTGKR